MFAVTMLMAVITLMEERAMNELLKGLSSSDPERRASAAEQLSHLGEEAQPAALSLVRCAADEAETVREFAVSALEGMGAPAASDVPRLIECLDSGESDIVYWSATLLGRLESEAAVAVDPLALVLAKPAPPAACERAAWALGRIGLLTPKATAALRGATTSENPRLARLATQALSAR